MLAARYSIFVENYSKMNLSVAFLSVNERQYIGINAKTFDPSFPQRMRQMGGAYWSADAKYWLLPYTCWQWNRVKHHFQEVNFFFEADFIPPTEAAELLPELLPEQSTRSSTITDEIITLSQHPDDVRYMRHRAWNQKPDECLCMEGKVKKTGVPYFLQKHGKHSKVIWPYIVLLNGYLKDKMVAPIASGVCKHFSLKQKLMQESIPMPQYIPSDIRLPPTYWSRAWIYVIYKACWATKVAKLQKYTRT